jgi:N6-L-threonylcarbamoyladenine synthase
MIVLGIESSCDDTAVALLDSNGSLFSEMTSGQDDVHARFGGVVPELASRSHLQ